MDKRTFSWPLIGAIIIFVLLGMFFIDPIAQNTNYHHFSDSRTLLGVSNFWNVISNVIFALAGLAGLLVVLSAGYSSFPKQLRLAYYVFFAGVLLVSLGSGYYHLEPNNATLVWDRLPMTIAFMALFSIIIGECVALELGKKLLVPLLVLGGFAVGYWHYTEQLGRGDLRPYIVVQFLPLIIIPFILIIAPPVFGRASGYWWLLGSYVLAKVCEHWDTYIYHIGFGLSGHTLKHAIAAVGVLLLVLAYHKRNQLTVKTQ
ncbi:MAG: hypothetical protein RL497_1036 [Pseudomonadota bacterium]|jgi:hypothetical protein